jgi:hypothetical protein
MIRLTGPTGRMVVIKKSRDQITIERARGWIVYLLDEARPDPIELAILSLVMDGRNYGMTRRGLGRELDYLRSQRLVKVFPLGHDEELSSVDQAKLLQRYSSSERDSDCGGSLCARITADGINFQAGLIAIDGVWRAE